MPTPINPTAMRIRPTADLIAAIRQRIKRMDALLAEAKKTNAQVRRDWEAQCRREPPF